MLEAILLNVEAALESPFKLNQAEQAHRERERSRMVKQAGNIGDKLHRVSDGFAQARP